LVTPLLLALADAAAAAYLVTYGLRRERHDKARVLIVGGMLAVCAVALLVIAWSSSTEPNRPQQPPTSPVQQTEPGTSV
jgi:hypothetical protein